MISLRPSDLAREHGISTQAVRNYERDGCIPPAERTPSGYRVYTEAHAAALRAFLALVPAHGHAPAVGIMNALHDDRLDDALALIDRGHHQALRDRETLDAVKSAIHHLTQEPPTPEVAAPERPAASRPAGDTGPAPWTIGELAHRLGVTPATLRKWEDAGILAPAREPVTGYRLFRTEDVRDAELAHLLRRGGHRLDHIATVVQQVRTAGGTAPLARALDDWQHKLTARGLALLTAASRLSDYLTLTGRTPGR
ncbi:TioE family transcriptional regulator [Streptomyces sp. NPDC015131]|uniref:TioE family transcriptional regulator n=1 Tax=Streptomyces sp. NPDC015131 TaxID=3364941 RepID=UPI0036F80F73